MCKNTKKNASSTFFNLPVPFFIFFYESTFRTVGLQ